MRIGKSCGMVIVIFWVVVLSAGCSSSSGGNDNSDVSSDFQTYTTPGSDLVLQIPDTLDVSQDEIQDIHYHADQVTHCYSTNRESIDIVLAQACSNYDMYYLFPQYFPQNLDNILDVESYVDYMRINDPFTFYFSPQDFIEVQSFMSGNISFIGFGLDCNGPTVTDQTPLMINYIDPYTRAWIDGFQVGDKIVGIDGISIEGMDCDEVVLLFPDAEGETVEITVEREGAEISIDTAAEEHVGLLLSEDTAYLDARSFTDTTGEQVRLDYEALQREAGGKINKLILDLRNNSGGSLFGALELVDFLINMDDGSYPIVSFSGPAFDDETDYLGTFTDFYIGDFDNTNFVLLIDENSASASEIVAAALKYYGTATLMGRTTFGKGIGQSVGNLIDGSGIVIPSIYMLPPSGESYQGIGIQPDSYVNASVSSFDDDPVLDAAVEYLTTGVVTASASLQRVEKYRMSVSDRLVDPLKKKLLKVSKRGNYY